MCPICIDGAVGSTPTYAPIRLLLMRPSRPSLPLRIAISCSLHLQGEFPYRSPATCLTKPLSSNMLRTLFSWPASIFFARSFQSHSAISRFSRVRWCMSRLDGRLTVRRRRHASQMYGRTFETDDRRDSVDIGDADSSGTRVGLFLSVAVASLLLRSCRDLLRKRSAAP